MEGGASQVELASQLAVEPAAWTLLAGAWRQLRDGRCELAIEELWELGLGMGVGGMLGGPAQCLCLLMGRARGGRLTQLLAGRLVTGK